MPKFEVVSPYQPSGDQPEAIDALAAGIENGLKEQVLLGVTGSGKTYTMAKVIEKVQRPTLVLAHNKTLAAQLCAEFKEFFPNNAVEYFVSYYDYYQPEAYIPHTDTYIAKDASTNDEIDRLRLSATCALLERRDVIVVSSVSCIYGLGEPDDFAQMVISLRQGAEWDRDELLRRLVENRYERNDVAFERNRFRVRGDTVEIYPAYYKDHAIRVEFFGDEIDRISDFHPLTGTVNRVYEEFIKLSGLPGAPAAQKCTAPVLPLPQRLVKTLGDVFVPILPAIVAAGLLTGILDALGRALPAVAAADWFSFLKMVSGTAFVSLPVLVALSSARVFGGNLFLGGVVGLCMVHPALLNAWSVGTAENVPVWHLLCFNVKQVGYQGHVIPAIIAVWLMSRLERWFRSRVPAALDLFVTPLCTVLITTFVTFTILGPCFSFAENCMIGLARQLSTVGHGIGALVMGALYPVTVVCGLHHMYNVIEAGLLSAGSLNIWMPIASAANFAQCGACLAVAFKTRDPKNKTVAIPSALSAALGITEPAIFGVNLRYVRPFVCAMVGGAVGAWFGTVTGIGATAYGVTGLPGFLIVGGYILPYAELLALSGGVAFAATWLFWQDAPAQDNQIQTNPDEVTAVTYTNGTITLRFSLQDGRWCWSDDKTFPLDGSYITALLADVQGGPPISITEEDLESYGLGGVTKYIEITTAEKTVTYYLGDPCGDGSSYLSRDDDESTVYRAPDDLSARLDRSIYDMAQLPTLPALTADVLRSVTIAASGAERTFTVDGGVWTEGGADVSAETASLADVLSQPAFSGCVDYHPGSGAAAICGLDPANVTLTAVYAAGSKEATFTLLLGGARGDGYYAALTGDDTIYQLPAEQAAPILALAPQA
mgnify:CR=1 FL=1